MLAHATSADGTKIAWETSGHGRPLVLVHGTSADHRRWTPIRGALEQQFMVCAVDRRGRGGSGDTPLAPPAGVVNGIAAAHLFVREAEDIVAVASALGEEVYVLGHSFGAIVALEAARRTRSIARLALYEPPIVTTAPFVMPGLVEQLEQHLAAGDRDGLVTTFLRVGASLDEAGLAAQRALPAWAGRVAAAHTIPRELRAQAGYRFTGSFTTPTLLLVGEASPPPFHAAIAHLYACLPGSRVVRLPGQGHVAMDTAPDLFLREVLGFFA